MPIQGLAANLINMLDGLASPACRGERVVTRMEKSVGTHFLYSADASWATAECCGTVPNARVPKSGVTTASVEIGGSVYALSEFFFDAKVQGNAG